ncbi:YqaJ viral recombinase family protein [Brevibacterium oceani]|uniref:YqaJ viral recombinase family protein n=1 Tax=Brevibacterium oceani TaxID=358099 RepID=UPI0015E787B6|nr:YqaJ viral recombinase family protein [Brevibacterium oceani]
MTFTYSVDSTDEAAWHAARSTTDDGQIVVTASEVAALASGGTSTWANLRAEKAGGKSRWGGNEYTEWGHEREPVIAGAVHALYPQLLANTRLVISDDDPRWRATPDMIGETGDMLCQIKTVLWAGEKWVAFDVPKRYYDQCQWEMLVTGATINLLAVEYYDRLEDGVFVPTFLFEDPHIIPIERDDARIAEIIAIAEQFVGMGEPDTLDLYLADYARADAREKAAKAEKEAARKLIAKEIAERPGGKYVSDLGSVTQGQDTTKTVTVLNEARLKEKAPKTWERYVEEQTKTTKGRLTITPAKDKEAA